MHAAEHRNHGDPTQPYVAMSRKEALALAGELVRAINAAGSVAQVLTLIAFFEQHCKAHGLKGTVVERRL